jgi:radical SAM superfamily enzyme YgiQ (UPF0313 family)
LFAINQDATLKILLSTLNARYAHAALGLRYLRANLREFRAQCVIQEFVIGQKTEDIVEQILAQQPDVLGLGVYIWNAVESERLVAQLKLLRPELIIVLGGPEVSFEYEHQAIVQQADYLITGWGDQSFYELIAALQNTQPLASDDIALSKVIRGKQPPLAALAMPYAEFSDHDLSQRTLYVEASRGCPFKCEFCLSSLDKTAWAFPQAEFLQQLDQLYQRGARVFKFVDRTFNLKIDASLAILHFFLDKISAAQRAAEPLPFLHFELVPDHLPDKLRETITRFPAGTLQFEIGIQTFNPSVQALVSRRQKNALALDNLRWLRQSTQAHLHVDLIAGLPGEDMESFAAGFDQLVAVAPHEIQFGILKRLRGTPIIRHTEPFKLLFNAEPPYNILQTDRLDFQSLQRMSRFARYWDLIANSGRFPRVLPWLLAARPFHEFMAFSDATFAQTQSAHSLSLERLFDAIEQYLRQSRADPEPALAALKLDRETAASRARSRAAPSSRQGNTPARQQRHLSQAS